VRCAILYFSLNFGTRGGRKWRLDGLEKILLPQASGPDKRPDEMIRALHKVTAGVNSFYLSAFDRQ